MLSNDEKSQQIQIISYYQYRSMTRGNGSIVETLLSHGRKSKSVCKVQQQLGICHERAVKIRGVSTREKLQLLPSTACYEVEWKI